MKRKRNTKCEAEGEGEGEGEGERSVVVVFPSALCESTARVAWLVQSVRVCGGQAEVYSGVGEALGYSAAMGFSWKMLVGPAMLVGMKVLKIDYDVPQNLLIIRILYAVSQLALFGALFVIYQRINQEGDEKKTVRVKVPSPA